MLAELSNAEVLCCGCCLSHSKARQYRFEVLLTTYELILKDAHVLGRCGKMIANALLAFEQPGQRGRRCAAVLHEQGTVLAPVAPVAQSPMSTFALVCVLAHFSSYTFVLMRGSPA